MSEQREVHRVLVKARNLLAKRGLTKHCLVEDDGRVCARGAIGLACGGSYSVATGADAFYEAFERNGGREAEAALGDVVGSSYGVPFWNNADGRTKAEVLAAFDRAIAATAPDPDLSFLEHQDGVSARPSSSDDHAARPLKAV